MITLPIPALALASLLAPISHAEGPADVGAWVRASGVRPEAADRLRAWEDDEQRVSEDFVLRYPAWVQGRIVAAVERRLPSAATACEPSAQVGFVEPGSVGETEADRDFEESTFRVESLHCLDHGDAAQAMAIYNSEAFRLQVMPGLERYSLEGDQVCIDTGAVMGVVGRTEICLAARGLEGQGVSAFHTRLVHSADEPEAQGIFLRESVVAFVDRAQGGVAVYRVVYTRGKDMGAVQRAVLSRVAGGSQEKIAEALGEQLR
jgi:hypothetical protein